MNFVDAKECETYQRDNGKTICVSELTAQKLMERGWELTKIIVKESESKDPNNNHLVIFNKTTSYWFNENNELMIDEYRSNFDILIHLDKKEYQTNDKVSITIVSSARNLDSNLIESFDHYDENIITSIETRESALKTYKFVETGPDTSIFTSNVQLIDYRDAAENGIKYGDDALVVSPDDGISVSASVNEKFTSIGSAVIKGSSYSP